MKINEQRGSPRRPTAEIPVGEVFIYRGDYYMRTDEVGLHDTAHIKTVKLKTGEAHIHHQRTHVTPVEAELFVKNTV